MQRRRRVLLSALLVLAVGGVGHAGAQLDLVLPEDVGVYGHDDPRRDAQEERRRARAADDAGPRDITCRGGPARSPNYWNCERVMPVPGNPPAAADWIRQNVIRINRPR